MGSMKEGRTYIMPVSNGVGIVNVTFDISALARAGIFFAHAPEKAKIAISHAVNRSLENFRTIAVRETTKKYFVSRSEVWDSITLKKSYGGAMHGDIISKGKRKPLTDYKVSPKSFRPGKKQNISAAVKRAGGLKPLPQAFYMAHGSGGRFFLFYRTRDGKFQSYRAPSIPQIMKNEGTVAEVERSSRKTFIERLDHELKRAGFLP